MSWFRVDDKFHGHPKVKGLKAQDPLSLWVLCGSYCSDHIKLGGRVPLNVAADFCHSETKAKSFGATLASRGLWEEDPAGWMKFHDWNEYQPSSEARDERRAELSAKRAIAGRLGAEKRWQKPAEPIVSAISKNGIQVAPDGPVPIPSRPIPEEKKEDISLPTGTTLALNLSPTSEASKMPKKSTLSPTRQEARIFEHFIAAKKRWSPRTGHASFSPQRLRNTREALRNYPLQDLLDACDGLFLDEFYTKDNGKLADVYYAMRETNIEKFRDLWRENKRSTEEPAEKFGVGQPWIDRLPPTAAERAEAARLAQEAAGQPKGPLKATSAPDDGNSEEYDDAPSVELPEDPTLEALAARCLP